MYCLPTGGFEPKKHSDLITCAKAELSEEVCGEHSSAQAAPRKHLRHANVHAAAAQHRAQLPRHLHHAPHRPQALLAGGRWLPLLPPGHAGLSEVKWCMNRFAPYLVIAPHADASPGARDLEEVAMEVRCAQMRAPAHARLAGRPRVPRCLLRLPRNARPADVRRASPAPARRSVLPPPLPRQVLRVPVEEFKRLMLGGDMLLPSITTGFMALERLQQEGLL